MFTFVDDTVLDPFLGSGTTSLAAKNLGRNSVGYEINEAFLPIISGKLGLHQGSILEDTAYQILRQEDPRLDLKQEIGKLPYVFKDPIKFDKKVDPKKLEFGSKIDNTPAKREEYYRVKEVISPERLILNDGLVVRLLGIKQELEKKEEAVRFLEERVKGKKVSLKFDAKKYDDENNLLCYLYMENRTFVNAHLIKNHLVVVDRSSAYSYKERFLNYEKSNNKR